jgi:hypothetical protein
MRCAVPAVIPACCFVLSSQHAGPQVNWSIFTGCQASSHAQAAFTSTHAAQHVTLAHMRPSCHRTRAKMTATTRRRSRRVTRRRPSTWPTFRASAATRITTSLEQTRSAMLLGAPHIVPCVHRPLRQMWHLARLCVYMSCMSSAGCPPCHKALHPAERFSWTYLIPRQPTPRHTGIWVMCMCRNHPSAAAA